MTETTGGPALRRAGALLVLLAVWESLSRIGWLDPFYAPPPSAVARVMVDLAGGELWPHLGATAIAAIAGLAAGLAIGIVLGFAAALLPRLAELLEPVMILLNAIPRVILAPLFVIWLGIGLASKLALATILVAVLIFFAVFNGIKEVDRRLVERVRTLGGGAASSSARSTSRPSPPGCWGTSRSRWASPSPAPSSASSSPRAAASATCSSSRRAPTTRP